MVERLSVTDEATLARGFLVSSVTPLDSTFPHVSVMSDRVHDALVQTQGEQRRLLDGIGIVIGAGSAQLSAFVSGLHDLDTTLADETAG